MKSIGTIIGMNPLTETSLIVQWCTTDHGIVKAVAKGAKRPRSPFAGKLDLFFLTEIELHPSKTGDLHILRDIAVIDTRLGLRKSYTQTLAASYFVKLVLRATEPATPIPEIDDLLNRGLGFLAGQSPTRRAVEHFENQLARILGLEEPGVDARQGLAELFGGLPRQREEILGRLGD